LGGWEVRVAANKLVNSLTADPYHLRDLGHADQLHHRPRLSPRPTIVNTDCCRSYHLVDRRSDRNGDEHGVLDRDYRLTGPPRVAMRRNLAEK
jgi:hypothetical protein